MATTAMNYATKETMTWTMTAPSSDITLLIGRQSTKVDNSQASFKFMDAVIGGRFQGPVSGAAAGVIEVFGYGSWDGGTTFNADCTGTDGALTLVAAVKELLKGPLEVLTTNLTNGEDYYWGPTTLSSIFGGILPSQWGLWGVHDAGGALQTSVTEWQGIKFDSA